MQRFGNLKEIMQVTDTIHKYIADSKILLSVAVIQFLKNDLIKRPLKLFCSENRRRSLEVMADRYDDSI